MSKMIAWQKDFNQSQYLSQVERCYSAVIIKEDVDCIQCPCAFCQKT